MATLKGSSKKSVLTGKPVGVHPALTETNLNERFRACSETLENLTLPSYSGDVPVRFLSVEIESDVGVRFTVQIPDAYKDRAGLTDFRKDWNRLEDDLPSWNNVGGNLQDGIPPVFAPQKGADTKSSPPTTESSSSGIQTNPSNWRGTFEGSPCPLPVQREYYDLVDTRYSLEDEEYPDPIAAMTLASMSIARVGDTQADEVRIPAPTVEPTSRSRITTEDLEEILALPILDGGFIVRSVSGSGKSTACRLFRDYGVPIFEPHHLPEAYQTSAKIKALVERGCIVLTNSQKHIPAGYKKCLYVYTTLVRAHSNMFHRRDKNKLLNREETIEMLNRIWKPFSIAENRVFLPDGCYLSDLIWSIIWNAGARIEHENAMRSGSDDTSQSDDQSDVEVTDTPSTFEPDDYGPGNHSPKKEPDMASIPPRPG